MEKKDIIELLDVLYGMVTEAWSVPLGNDKCIIERDKAVEIINDIKASLPTSLAEAQRLVAARDEFVGNAKREAEALRKSAEEKARVMIEEQEIVRVARAKSAEMIEAAEAKSKELRQMASQYVEEIIRQTEESMSSALANVQNIHKALMKLDIAKETKPTHVAATPAESPVVQEASPFDEEGVDELGFITIQ